MDVSQLLFIDCEWNSYGGALLSMALVPADPDKAPFYEALHCADILIDPWVAEHVVPKLDRPAIGLEDFQRQLEGYLSQRGPVVIVADWPEDIAWLSRMLITGPGQRLRYPDHDGGLTFIVAPIDAESTRPHNALADAMALRDAFLARMESR